VKLIKVLLAIFAVLMVQTMLLTKNQWLQSIDLFLLLNIYYALNFSQLSALALAVFSGLVQDTFSQGILGVNGFSKTVVAYFVGFLSTRIMIKHPLIILLLIILSTAMDYLMITALYRVFSLSRPALPLPFLLASAVLNGITGLIGYQIADKIRLRKEYV
jgi:rod shape-determining protein MreD